MVLLGEAYRIQYIAGYSASTKTRDVAVCALSCLQFLSATFRCCHALSCCHTDISACADSGDDCEGRVFYCYNPVRMSRDVCLRRCCLGRVYPFPGQHPVEHSSVRCDRSGCGL